MNRDADKHFAALNERTRLAHERRVREVEAQAHRDLAVRRLDALMPTTGVKWCTLEADFDGCTL